ncbi:MAG: hypothetical protein ISP49_22100 [Reyranella sp.]|nr:hypothetical protein [Reyranella sp.]
MMLRQSLLIGIAGLGLAGAAVAQQRGQSREDLLDALTRHIQICGEMTDTQSRLSCYDRLQTQVGGVAPPAQPTPTPLQASPAPAPTPLGPPTSIGPGSTMGSAGGSSGGGISSSPLTPQPLGVPGGGTATLGGGAGVGAQPTSRDPDAAFDPRSSSYQPPQSMGPKPQPQVRRSGQRPIPNFATPQPLVTLAAANLTYGDSRYWQVTITLTSNTPRPLNAQAECTFLNAGQPVMTDYFGPIMIQPGEQITTELIGPPTTSYVDMTNCRLTSP